MATDIPRISFTKGVATITATLDETWEVTYSLALHPPARPVVTDVHVGLRPGVTLPPGGLASDTLRRVRLTEHVVHLDAMVRRMRQPPRDPADRARWEQEREFREHWLRWTGLGPVLDATPSSPPGAGRPRLDDALLARVGQAYEAAVATRSLHPAVDAARQLKLTLERFRDLLHRARTRKIVTAGSPGIATGGLTPYGRSLLTKTRRTRR
jgi:hypothetical protein